MGRTGRLYGCPVELTLDLLGGKWKTVILARLKQSPLRYGELRRAVPGLADKVLTQRLRDLEEAGFVERSKPPGGQARYRLTSLGRSLAPALEAMYAWGLGAAPRLGARFRPVLDGESAVSPVSMPISRKLRSLR
jgi:DNA-binding HxlR family transcriptional regulator